MDKLINTHTHTVDKNINDELYWAQGLGTEKNKPRTRDLEKHKRYMSASTDKLKYTQRTCTVPGSGGQSAQVLSRLRL